jgi:hypothetical protein
LQVLELVDPNRAGSVWMRIVYRVEITLMHIIYSAKGHFSIVSHSARIVTATFGLALDENLKRVKVDEGVQL